MVGTLFKDESINMAFSWILNALLVVSKDLDFFLAPIARLENWRREGDTHFKALR
jgi:hypothetical protein